MQGIGCCSFQQRVRTLFRTRRVFRPAAGVVACPLLSNGWSGDQSIVPNSRICCIFAQERYFLLLPAELYEKHDEEKDVIPAISPEPVKAPVSEISGQKIPILSGRTIISQSEASSSSKTLHLLAAFCIFSCKAQLWIVLSCVWSLFRSSSAYW